MPSSRFSAVYAAGFVLAVLGAPHDSLAQTAAPEGLVQQLTQCRSIQDDAQRLVCFDEASAPFVSGDIVVMDRNQVRETNRNLFGFSGPQLDLFGNGSEQVDTITATLSEARQTGTGPWILTLSDGSVWMQTDSDHQRLRFRPGLEVTVRRAAFGSYLLRAGSLRSIRVERR